MKRRSFLQLIIGVALSPSVLLAESKEIDSKVIYPVVEPIEGSPICGYRGRSVVDAGYFYCPYIPLQMS